MIGTVEEKRVETKGRPLVIVGNWKMNKTIQDAIAYVKAFLPLVHQPVYLAVPFTAIHTVAQLCAKTPLVVGAQNMHDAEEGAFTGEVAGRMLKEAGAAFVIIGHSERRRFFHESDSMINKKIKRAIQDGLRPLLCIGETREERDAGETEKSLSEQIEKALAGLSAEELSGLMLAYEPVWAIGSMHAATPAVAEAAHAFCRKAIADICGADFAAKLPILYGGSVTPENGQALIDQPDIDGLLVGTASLSVDTFGKIANLKSTKPFNVHR